jgi:hypothetical protein
MTLDFNTQAARLSFRLLFDADEGAFVILGMGGNTVQLPPDMNHALIALRADCLGLHQAHEQIAAACDAVDQPAHG